MAEGQFRGNRMTTFGLLIKQAREKVGLTQEEVANRCGLVHSTYNKYERGGATYPPEPSVLSKLGAALNLTEDEMLVAMGYKPQPGTVSEAVRHRIIRDTSVSEYLAESREIHSEDAVAAVEAIIRTARGTREKKLVDGHFCHQSILPITSIVAFCRLASATLRCCVSSFGWYVSAQYSSLAQVLTRAHDWSDNYVHYPAGRLRVALASDLGVMHVQL